MKKILSYISIFIILSGLFLPAFNTQAATSTSAPVPIADLPGTCKNYRMGELISTTITKKADCPATGTWTANPAPNPVPNPTGNPKTGPDYSRPVTDYVLLAPLPCDQNDPICDPTTGTLKNYDTSDGSNAIGKYLNVMIKIFIGLCSVLAMIMIVMGGLEYMTSELISSKESGKQKITGAILGLILALGSWAILNTINPDLLKTETTSLESVEVVVDLEADVPQTYDPVTKKFPNGAVFGSPWDDSHGKPLVPCKTNTDTGCLPLFVTVNAKECSTIGEKGCTSTRGLDTSTLQSIQWGCGCSLMVTGATESWLHGGKTGSTSHMTGSGTVDLRPTPELDKYLSGGKPLVKMQRYPQAGGPYLWEGDHWHIGK